MIFNGSKRTEVERPSGLERLTHCNVVVKASCNFCSDITYISELGIYKQTFETIGTSLRAKTLENKGKMLVSKRTRKSCFDPVSNRGPLVCETNVITTTPLNLLRI